MEMKGANLLAIALLFCLSTISSAQHYAVATYYTDPYLPSACFGFEDQGIALISLSDKLWDDGKACGHSYIVSCKFEPGNDCVEQMAKVPGIEAIVVDNCGDCGGTDMELSEPVFASIARLDAGSAVISYRRFS